MKGRKEKYIKYANFLSKQIIEVNRIQTQIFTNIHYV